LSTGNSARQDHIVQECGVGLVRIKRDGNRLAFAARLCAGPAQSKLTC
jgi:NOL1/NOP2/fmu family ribosome biogenesis protein